MFQYVRHKQVILEAYDQQCDEAAKIFAEYQRRIHQYVDQARDIRMLITGSANDVVDDLHAPGEKAVYSAIKGLRSSDDSVLIEMSREKNTRKACETLAAHMTEKIRTTFPAYEGSGISMNSQIDAAKLSLDLDGEIPEDIKVIIRDALKNPPLLLQSITTYALRSSALIHRETEKIEIRAVAESLRCFSELSVCLVALSSFFLLIFFIGSLC